MGIAALVFGILGVVTCWVPFLGAVLGLIGLFLGIITLLKKKGNKAFGIIGVVLGGIGMIISVIATILFFVVADYGTDLLEDYQAKNAQAEAPFNN